MGRTLRRTSAPGGPWFEFYREVCPICGHKGGCMIHDDQNRVVCIRVGSDIEWAKNSALPGYLHFLEGKPKKYDFSNVPEIEDNPKKDDAALNRVFKALINCTQIDAKHKSHLMSDSRQLTETQIKIRQYRSFPDKPWQVVKEISERLGDSDFVGIPGFYIRDGKYGKYYTLNGFTGILIPFRNHLNQIIGFQYRVDEVKNDITIRNAIKGFKARIVEQPNKVECTVARGYIKVFEGEIDKDWKAITDKNGKLIAEIKLSAGQRYFWLSSANKEGGTGAGNPAPVHVSVPSEDLKEWKTSTKRRARTVWLGEGPLKNDIAVDKIVELYDPEELEDIGTTIIGLPGVNSWRLALPYLKEMDVEIVNIAFDADAINNPYVKQHLFDCTKMLKSLGYSANIVLWNDNHGKGLDDLFLNNKLPVIKKLF
ncbi:DUF3854 domain-containing protein [Alkalihalobacillus sp. BA299]|uniref:DUF3854 domain-containing protein n=1 Tax=Alkalihalobacillus sp. BA299 TaxID=2815938 RepID=UPI001ADAEA88|nr:DUF3854 domain-containing protein [Alkalihalobacillus sp. BA299]